MSTLWPRSRRGASPQHGPGGPAAATVREAGEEGDCDGGRNEGQKKPGSLHPILL